jgi:DNA primase
LPTGCTLADDRVALTQRIKEANDIVDVVGSYVSLRPAGPTFKGLCPFHDDRRPSFDVDPRRQRYKCWACGKSGDVFTFIEETERISFLEARELLARRAGIPLEKTIISQPGQSRALMFDVVRWAAEQFHQCLLDSPLADAARVYLAERQLTGETIRRFGLGFALPSGEWLVQKASAAGLSTELLEKVGLIAARTEGTGYYDRFRDRVMFPIRDARGQTVGFGGRILPSSPLSARAPKYYNSAETILFSKSDQLYGIDQARQAAGKVGYVAVVEGYTDVLMAHQMGIAQVVATMGTALNVRHVQKLRGLVPRVVLVFDADAGGDTGVDRALEVFVSMEMDLRVATLPEGLDPCDLLVRHGPESFQSALTKAEDVLEFKLSRVCTQNDLRTVEGRRQAIDAVLTVLALAPETRSVKLELMVNRIAHRLGVLKEETLWARLMELREKRASGARDPRRPAAGKPTGGGPWDAAGQGPEVRQASAAVHEVELLEVLLADPGLVATASAELPARVVEHPGLRLLLEGLYRLQAEGVVPDLDQLRSRIDNQALLAKALHLQELGSTKNDKPAYLREVLGRFRERQQAQVKQELQNQLLAARDHDTAVELLRQLQNQTGG